MDIQKLLKKSSLSKKVGSSLTIVSVCFRIIKKHFEPASDLSQIEGSIKHNILFIKNMPREANIELYIKKQQIIAEIDKELAVYDFKYTLKDIKMK